MHKIYNDNYSASENKCNKIAIIIDDYQNILGKNTDGIFKDLSMKVVGKQLDSSQVSQIAGRNFKTIIENLSDRYIFIFASYPALVTDTDRFQDESYVLEEFQGRFLLIDMTRLILKT